MTRQLLWVILTAVCCCLCSVPMPGAGESYDLRGVKGIETFQGSEAAKELLVRNGFVVADPAFKQIFEAYIKSPSIEEPSEKNPRGSSLPSFITTDSAWHTYLVLLEEGVKEMETIQSRRLLGLSRQFLTAVKARTQAGGSGSDDLVLFASVGLALQDEPHRQSLAGEAKRIVEGLRTGSSPVDVPVGFSLSPLLFRAQSFYTQSPELSDYFAARQWYASVVFRLANLRETKLAVTLSALVDGDPELLALWKQLSDPFDAFLAPAEDGTLREYVAAAKAVLGTNLLTGPVPDQQIAEIQKTLESRMALPRVSDQLLSPGQYTEFPKQTRGFRLLPPRRLPCAVCFHNTVDPKIPGRMYPSGLDFLAASPVLRSPAAVRAVQSQFGRQVGDLILKADCGPMPNSLHGDAMQLLAALQKPLPTQAPAALRSEAWSDLQLWTQLGAWAEQRHTWALHTKLSVMYMGIVTPPEGTVSPYPEFFAGLAKLTRRTAEAFEKAGLEQQFDGRTVANDLLELLTLSRGASRARDEKELEKLSGKLEQLSEFQSRFYEKHRAEIEKDNSTGGAYKKLEQELEALARRCATTGQASASDTETLRSFFECRQNIVGLLNGFAPVCDRLAELAKKSLAGQLFTDDDAKWIEGYGVTLAGFHFYYGNSYEVPRDDFPIVTRVFSNPLADSMLYAGLTRPQALYVIIPNGNTKQLYRGAVLTYREFVRPNAQLLDDTSWRELVSTGQTPPAPPFTSSFYAETSVAELMKKLRAAGRNEDAGYGDIDELLWQIGSRATEKDLTALMKVLTGANGEERSDIVEGIADIIAGLPWESHQKEIIELLASRDNTLADATARILVQRPAAVDAAALVSGFSRQPPRTRRLYCAILSQLPRQTEVTRKVLLQALHDSADGVRWQAALAIAKANWKDTQSESALLESLNDTNELVGAAAAYSLAQLKATNAAPVLLAKLRSRLQSPAIVSEEMQPEARAIVENARGEANHADKLLDVDNLTLRLSRTVTVIMQKMAGRRIPPRPFDFPMHNYNLADALIEALADLDYKPATEELFKLRGTVYDAEATRALNKLEPDRLTAELLATAKDKQLDSYVREQALVTLCNLSATNRVRELIPLLDDTTPIVYERRLPGPEWRVCDRAVATIAILLGWEHRLTLTYIRPEQREELMARARKWAESNP
jgi:HEAT repeat protein